MDNLEIQVIEGAKAHVGKTLTVNNVSLHEFRNLITGAESIRALGWTDYNGLCYDIIIREHKDGVTDAYLESGKSRIHLKKVTVL